MTPQDALIAIGSGLLSALAALTFLSGAPLALGLVYLAPLPLMMAGFARGPRVTAIGVLAGVVATGAIGGLSTAALFGLAQGLPSWAAVRLGLTPQRVDRGGAVANRGGAVANQGSVVDWPPAGIVLSGLTVLGGIFLVFAAIATEDGLSVAVAAQLDTAFSGFASNLAEADRQAMIQALMPLFPGSVAASWVMMAVVNASLAQRALVRIDQAIRPSPVFADLTLPQWMAWPLVGAAGLALTGSATGAGELEYLGRNLAIVLAAPYFFVGLAVFHTLARQVGHSSALLIAFYLVIAISLWAALVVAGVGIVEHWFGLRSRMSAVNPNAGNEDE